MNIPFIVLPDLLRDSLVPFLDLKSCVRLDSAVLVKNHRPNWLEGLTLALLCDPRIAVEEDGLSWMKKRKLRLLHIVLTGSTSDSEIAEHGQEVLSELLTLCIYCCQNITNIGVASMLQCCTKLRKLELEQCYQLTPFALRDVRPSALKELNIVDCTSLDDATFTELVVNCPNLETINITGCDKLTDVSVRTLACICTNLKAIQYCIFGRMTMQSVTYLAQYCPELRKIVDTYVYAPTTSEDFDYTYNNVLVELAQKCPLLEHVEVQAPFLTDNQLALFSQNCPHLHTFNIGLSEFTFGPGVTELVANCPLLTHLNLANTINISENVLVSIAEHCTTLTTLHLPGEMKFNSDLMCGIWRANPRLQTLVLDGCAPIDPLSFDVSSVEVSSLTHLDISSTNLTESSLLTLFSKCPMLAHLDMSFTNNASSTSVMTCLGRSCPFLHTLILTQCDGLDHPPPALSALAIYCISLATLRLAGTNATEEGLLAIIGKNAKLQFLDLSWCRQMSDTTLYTLTKSCAELHTLKLKDTLISAGAFCTLVKSCRKLRKMYLDCCGFVTVECITLLAQYNRRLEYLCVTHSEHLTDTIFGVLSLHCPFLRCLVLLECRNVLGRETKEMKEKYKGQLTMNIYTHS